MTTITLPRATVEQALEAMRCAVPTGKITLYEWDKAVSDLDAALAQQAEPHPTPSMAEITRLRAERDALADRLREVLAQLNDTIDAHRKRAVMNAWAEQKLARHGIPMPEGDPK